MKKIFSCVYAILFLANAYSQLSVRMSCTEKNQPLIGKGRLLVYFYKNEKPEPIHSVQPDDLKGTGNRFGTDVKWDGKKPINLTDLYGFPKRTLQNLDTGVYYVQAVYDIDTTTYRVFTSPNIYSSSKKVVIARKGKEKIDIILDKQFEKESFKDGKFTKFVSVKSKLLSDFWKRDVVITACVRLPPSFDSSSSKKYPVSYNIGGFGTSCKNYAYYGPDSGYINPWIRNKKPDMLQVLLDNDAPFGDSYQMNSENNGPYMDALIQELIPAIEKRFHGEGTPSSRFLTGGSTGGWVSLALQVFNPDFFNGCWSFYGDPVDFNFFQLVNVYKDENAYVNRFGNFNPSKRTVYGEPVLSIKDEVYFENTLGKNNSYVFSGDQWGSWNAVYSPKGKDGCPAAIWDPQTGKIDTTIANYWRKWDLNLYMQQNWKEIGPKLQGKLHIFMGDMDNYYLNNAMRLFEKFITKTENPKSDVELVFGPMQGHGWEPVNRIEVLQKMKERFDSTSKKGF